MVFIDFADVHAFNFIDQLQDRLVFMSKCRSASTEYAATAMSPACIYLQCSSVACANWQVTMYHIAAFGDTVLSVFVQYKVISILCMLVLSSCILMFNAHHFCRCQCGKCGAPALVAFSGKRQWSELINTGRKGKNRVTKFAIGPQNMRPEVSCNCADG
jgi:hypothetical protein